MRATERRTTSRRLALARAGLLLAFVVLAFRAAHLSVFDHRGVERGRDQIHGVVTLAPERGAILDRTGAELALTVDAPSVYANASRVEDVDAAAHALAKALGRSLGAMKRRLERRRGFVFLDRWVSPERAARVRALGIAGIALLDEPRRTYPHGALAGSVIGFSNIDGEGVRGVEQQEDEWLRGRHRRLEVERDGSGRLLVADPGWSTAGGDVQLTIDARLQADAETALAAAVERTRARGGTVVSLDPASGEILALAELPSFDPNRFRHTEYVATRSRAFLDASDPGSTFKAFLVAAALESGAIREGQTFDCEKGALALPGKTIRDREAHEELSAQDILRVSSNVGAVKIAHALGPSTHFQMLRRFGFGESTGSGFPDESAGVLRSWRAWRPVDHATIAFGQGVGVTAVQMAAATAAIANGGTWVRPRLVAARRSSDGVWTPTTSERVRKVLLPQTSRAVLAMLESAVRDGTGRRAALRGVRVAGKTGTAQKFDPVEGRYSDDRFTAWFIGVAPVDEPKLVVVAGLDEPLRPAHTGGSAAAPLFARVAAAQLARFGIITAPRYDAPRPTETRAPAPKTVHADVRKPAASAPKPPARRRAPAVLPGPPLAALLVPDFAGLSGEEARSLAAEYGLALRLVGSGEAVSQDPAPGTILRGGEGNVSVWLGAEGRREG